MNQNSKILYLIP